MPVRVFHGSADFPRSEPTLIGADQISRLPDRLPNPVATISVFMDIGCAYSTRPHALNFDAESLTRVRIEGSTVLFEVEDGRAVASNGALEIDLATGSIRPGTDDTNLGESTALLCHEALDLGDTSASSAHWSQNGSGGVDLLVAETHDCPELPCIAQLAGPQEIGPDSNWGGNHAEGEAGSLIMNQLGTAEETVHDGDWNEGDAAYLGFRMRDDSGQVLYGWAEIAISARGVTLRRFAYDRSGNSIRAGAAAA